MDYSYYPGCSLKGSAYSLDKDVRKIFKILGHNLVEIPDWNCCGALEYGGKELASLSRENMRKAEGGPAEIIAPCPACFKNLKDANKDANLSRKYTILHPLELFDKELMSSLKAKRDLKGMLFTPYYGCVLLRPEETAIKNKNIMEDIISFFGGEIDGEKVRDKCCGASRLFASKMVTEKLSKQLLNQTKGIIVVFCPLCHMAMKMFSKKRKVIYLTDLLLYVMGEKSSL
jgi:heterodisulfide reductase subunit B